MLFRLGWLFAWLLDMWRGPSAWPSVIAAVIVTGLFAWLVS